MEQIRIGLYFLPMQEIRAICGPQDLGKNRALPGQTHFRACVACREYMIECVDKSGGGSTFARNLLMRSLPECESGLVW